LDDLEKKGILNSALQTATSGQAVGRDIEKLFNNVQSYIDLNIE
jgi:hypothetical protein